MYNTSGRYKKSSSQARKPLAWMLWILRHARDSHTHNLSQFLSARDALAVHGNTFGDLRVLKHECHYYRVSDM
jgi:hypothetical protein